MKKVIGILFTALMSFASTQTHAQGAAFTGTATTPTVLGVAPILNTAADTLYFTFTHPTYSEVLGIQPVVTKASGTMAGNVVIYGAVYKSQGTSGAFTYVATGDTLKLTNITLNSSVIVKSKPIYQSYMAIYSGGTTVTGTLGLQLSWLIPR